jgi:hypothetical protein
MIDLTDIPEGTLFFCKDELPVIMFPQGHYVSAVTGTVLASIYELEVISRGDFMRLVDVWQESHGKRPHAKVERWYGERRGAAEAQRNFAARPRADIDDE